MASVLIIGVDPSVVDPNDPAFPPGTNPDTIAQGIEEALRDMRVRGWKAAHCAIMPDNTVESTISECLNQASWDVVVIGHLSAVVASQATVSTRPCFRAASASKRVFHFCDAK